jgi:outer membrane biosynthesis protein TonB
VSESAPGDLRSALVAAPRVSAAPGVVFAVLLHAGILAAALVLPRYFDRPAPLRKPIIAHMVALGKPRDQSLLPHKVIAPPPAPAAPQSPAPVSPAAPPAAPSKPSVTAKPAPPAPRAPTRQELMARALAHAAGQASPTQEKFDPDRAGEATGSAAGTAASAEAGDKYFTEVHDAILANYAVPSVISERERLFLSATVLAYISRDGAIVRHQFEKKSGNRFFDEALELAIQRTKLPPPPPELAKALRDEGVALNFKP